MLGYLFARLLGLDNIQHASGYTYATSALLATGLYVSTYGIDLVEARSHLRLIGAAVTIGVICKAAMIATVGILIFGDLHFILLGIVMAQIDPLSVASLSTGGRMSAKAKTILAAWSSFDDPVTALLTVYVASAFSGHSDVAGWGSYASNLALNLLLAAGALVAWRLARHRKRGAQLAVLSTVSAIAVQQFLMLGQALSGLYVRPAIDRFIAPVINIAIVLAAFAVGVVVVGSGISIARGLVLGCATYAAQIVAGFILTRGLARRDRVHLAFAQQNGITAIILALMLEARFDGTVAVVAPAIATVNICHAVANAAIDRQTG